MRPNIDPGVHVDYHMARLEAEAAAHRLAGASQPDGGHDRQRAVRLRLVGAGAAVLLATILVAGAVRAPESTAMSGTGAGAATRIASPTTGGGAYLVR